MSERHKPHNGRDLDGRYKVRQEDVEDKLADPAGPDFVRDDVRLGGAVEDTGPRAGQAGGEVTRLVEQNREDTGKLAEANADLPDLRSERGRGERGR
jgi:hypothetical protein